MLTGLGWFLKIPGSSVNVLLEVLLDLGVVLLDKIGVVGFLRCPFLTSKSRQRRQDKAEGMFP